MATYSHPFNATNQGALILKILKGTYEPIAQDFSTNLKDMIDLLLTHNYQARPSIASVLQHPSE